MFPEYSSLLTKVSTDSVIMNFSKTFNWFSSQFSLVTIVNFHKCILKDWVQCYSKHCIL